MVTGLGDFLASEEGTASSHEDVHRDLFTVAKLGVPCCPSAESGRVNCGVFMNE